jgi:hypothetical protein
MYNSTPLLLLFTPWGHVTIGPWVNETGKRTGNYVRRSISGISHIIRVKPTQETLLGRLHVPSFPPPSPSGWHGVRRTLLDLFPSLSFTSFSNTFSLP